MSANVSSRITLDHEIKVARMHIAADGRVRSHDLFMFRLARLLVFDVEVRCEGDVLADGQAEDAVLRGQLEAVDCGVVGCDCLF